MIKFTLDVAEDTLLKLLTLYVKVSESVLPYEVELGLRVVTSVKISSIVMLDTRTRVSPSMIPLTMFSMCIPRDASFLLSASARSMEYLHMEVSAYPYPDTFRANE